MPELFHVDTAHVAKWGHGSKIILGLHGWAGSYTDLNVFGQWLDPEKYTLYAIELPGRGKSKTLEQGHTINDYVRYLKQVLISLNVTKFSFISDCGFS